jgi:hypothetical protein
VTINYPVRTRKSRNAKRKNSWKSKELAARILAPLLKRKAGNLAQIPTKTPPGQLKK